VADTSDHLLAENLAGGAGVLLIRLRDRLTSAGADPDVLRTAGDLAAHQYLLDRLRNERSSDSVLSEEDSDDDTARSERLSAERVWIIDPLDGTREYGEGRDDWAVHVALVENHRPTVGAVALPARNLVLSTRSPQVLHESPPETIRVAVSRTRPPEIARTVAERLGATLVPMGSAGVKVVSVLLGESDVYLHAGGQKQWDNCAPVAVAVAAGAECTRLDGSELLYNLPAVEIDDLLVTRRELTAQVRQAIDDGSTFVGGAG